MIIGVGIDLVEIERIEANMSEKFIERILSEKEIQIFSQFKNEKRKKEFLAGRFSAKEAIFKAFQRSNEKNHNFQDISILNRSDGSPYVEFILHDELSYYLSITHTDHYASSLCIIEKKGS